MLHFPCPVLCMPSSGGDNCLGYEAAYHGILSSHTWSSILSHSSSHCVCNDHQIPEYTCGGCLDMHRTAKDACLRNRLQSIVPSHHRTFLLPPTGRLLHTTPNYLARWRHPSPRSPIPECPNVSFHPFQTAFFFGEGEGVTYHVDLLPPLVQLLETSLRLSCM